MNKPNNSNNDDEVVGDTLQDIMHTVLLTPYMGVFDEEGVIGQFLKPLELLYYLPPIPPPQSYPY